MPTENYSPNWHVRCVSVPGPDTDLTLHVAFDNARYMFGCGEGTQRAYVQKKLGLKGVEAIFLLDAQNRTRMGLPGVMMTAADGGAQQLSIVGPPDTSHFISTFRSSVMRSDFSVIPRPLPIGKTPNDVTEVFKSSNVTVKAVALVPPSLRTKPIETDTPPIDMHKFRPNFSKTRPAAFSRPELETWRNLVVSHMFDKNTNRAERSGRNRGSPFVRPDGLFAASWPEIKFPLPLPTAEEQATELVYILEPPPLRGKFNAERAKELGIPSGPMRGRLVKGEEIEVDDPSAEGGKRIVRPEDCLSGGGPGAVLIIVSCSPANVSSLLESTAFEPYQTPVLDSEQGRKVHVMVHRVGSTVWQNTAYQEWMTRFGKETQHYIADPHNYSNDVYFRSSAWKTLDLNTLDTEIFPRPLPSTSTNYEVQQLPPICTHLIPNHQIRMQPRGKLETLPNHEKDQPLSIEILSPKSRSRQITTKPLEVIEARTRAMKAVSAEFSRHSKRINRPGDDIEISTLGTGSAIPSKYRNVSSTVLSIPNLYKGQVGEILLDCGEGTLGQMRRKYGADGMYKLYAGLKMIFISHMHADHHLGLHSILEDRFRLGISSPLYILAPPSIGLHMQESASWQRPASDEALANIFFVNSTRLTKEPSYNRESADISLSSITETNPSFGKNLYIEGTEDRFNGSRRWPMDDCLGTTAAILNRYWAMVDQMLTDLDLKWIQVVEVFHRGAAYGLVMQHTSGWKIAYSGDTKPCQNLVNVGMNATLLIHEATLEDDKAEMAFAKGHSTFSQAIKVGKDMNAKHILLNHFSQRYPKVPKMPIPPPPPLFSPTSTSISPNVKVEPVVSISFDLMSIKVSEMWKMAYYMEPISLLFPDEEEGDDEVVKAVATDKNVDVTEVTKTPNKTKDDKPIEGHGRAIKRRKDARVANIVRDASPESWSSPEMKPTGKAKKQKKSPEQASATQEMEMTNGNDSDAGWAYSPSNDLKPDPIFQDIGNKKGEVSSHMEEPASLEFGLEADSTVSRDTFDQAIKRHHDQAEIAEMAGGTGLTPALEDVSMDDGGVDGGTAE